MEIIFRKQKRLSEVNPAPGQGAYIVCDASRIPLACQEKYRVGKHKENWRCGTTYDDGALDDGSWRRFQLSHIAQNKSRLI